MGLVFLDGVAVGLGQVAEAHNGLHFRCFVRRVGRLVRLGLDRALGVRSFH